MKPKTLENWSNTPTNKLTNRKLKLYTEIFLYYNLLITETILIKYREVNTYLEFNINPFGEILYDNKLINDETKTNLSNFNLYL